MKIDLKLQYVKAVIRSIVIIVLQNVKTVILRPVLNVLECHLIAKKNVSISSVNFVLMKDSVKMTILPSIFTISLNVRYVIRFIAKTVEIIISVTYVQFFVVQIVFRNVLVVIKTYAFTVLNIMKCQFNKQYIK